MVTAGPGSRDGEEEVGPNGRYFGFDDGLTVPASSAALNRTVTIADGWRQFCASMMLSAVRLAAEKRAAISEGTLRNSEYRDLSVAIRNARNWIIDPDTGTVTFRECCDAMDVDCDRVHRRVLAYVHRRRNQ